MEVELRVEQGRKEPKIVILTGTETPELRELARKLAGLALDPIPAYQEERAVLLEQGDILRFYTQGKGVWAQTADGVYTVRLRLYELEERLDPKRFVRISHSEIVNLKQVTALDLSLTGTIRMTLKGGTGTFVSRRYVKKIKQALEL